jgi:NAD(P)H dehydrogenase (quinone)
VIDAAKKAGVKHIAYTSLLHAHASPIAALAQEHRPTEVNLQASGIPFTVLRNSWYTENYTASIPTILSRGSIIGAAGEGKISSAPRADYAEAAAVVLTTPGHEGKTYELGGDVAFTLSDLAAEISRQTGKTIPYKNMSETEYAAALAASGFPAAVAEMIAGLDKGVAQNALFDDSRQLSKLIGRPTTPLSAAVAAALKG